MPLPTLTRCRPGSRRARPARPLTARPASLMGLALAIAMALAAPSPAVGQGAGLRGTVVTDGGAPVRYATVSLAGSQRGVLTGAEGRFGMPGLAPGRYRLVVSAPGYAVLEREVSVPTSGPVTLVLRPDPVALEALTVTGTMKRSSVAESPVKVEVVPRRVLQRMATDNLTETIQYVNGLYTQVDCGVCYTNNIRINGMEGPYTAVLIDGMPIMSALASVYGLNGINPALIEQIEIVKGPASTLYGSEAMAGVINVITKDPRFAPRLAVEFRGTSDAEGTLDFALASEPDDLSGFLSGSVAYNQRFVDDNGDGFSDFPRVRRGVLFGKLSGTAEGARRGDLSAKLLVEDRFGGVEAWTGADRGSEEVYGESVVTRRAEVIGSWVPGGAEALRLEGSYTWHDQESFYGATGYHGSQHVAFGSVVWSARAGRHDLLAGATARWEAYDDDTPATMDADRRLVPGLLVQDEYRWTSDLSVLGGLRADHHQDHGIILSPRLALKWSPLEHTAVRLNAGTGFRVVHLFTEDHAALTGSRDVVVASELRPERSRSLTINLNQVLEVGPNPMMIDLDLFHTRFSNKIVPDYDLDPELIVYENLSGHAVSRGVSLSFNQNVDFDRFLYSVGVTLQDVYTADGGAREDEFFAPTVRGVATATWAFRSIPLTLDYTGSVTGPMRLPSYDEPFSRPTRSPTYALHNVQGSWALGGGAELQLSVRNLFDYVQPSPLVNPAEPFSDSFDTAYVYGPLRGRHVMVGVRYGMAR